MLYYFQKYTILLLKKNQKYVLMLSKVLNYILINMLSNFMVNTSATKLPLRVKVTFVSNFNTAMTNKAKNSKSMAIREVKKSIANKNLRFSDGHRVIYP
jgi:hypothetical protein